MKADEKFDQYIITKVYKNKTKSGMGSYL